MVIDQRFQATEPIRAGLATVLIPVQTIADMPSSVGNRVTETLKTRRELEDELATLKAKQFAYEVRLQKIAALEQENIRLRRLLDSTYSLGERVLIAELIKVDMDPYKQIITIDKGSIDGVTENQPMLDSKGVVGQVLKTSTYRSTGLLISDPGHSVPVQINRNGLRSIVTGTGAYDHLELLYVPNNSDVAVGDLLVTSGLGGVFPANYPVATITEFTPQPERPFATVMAKPLAELDRIREVVLIWEEALNSKEPASPNAAAEEQPTTTEVAQ